MADLQAQIEKIVGDAAVRITALFKAEAAGLLRAFGGSSERAAQAPRAGRAATASTARRKGAKRSATEIDATIKRLAALITRRPGLRVEELNRELGTQTRDVALPLKKLIAEKLIRTKGTRRATKYFKK